MNRKYGVAIGLAASWLALDLLTKAWALRALAGGVRMELFGGLLPLTLAFNTGAAFGLRIGNDPRLVFIPITLVAIAFLISLLRSALATDWVRIIGISLVLGGAVGNLYDRVRWERGVVDFLGPVDLGFALFPIFNVADIGITCGAMLLGWSLWQEDRMAARAEARASPPA
jgi:signal peptidase II